MTTLTLMTWLMDVGRVPLVEHLAIAVVRTILRSLVAAKIVGLKAEAPLS